jgi:hypothetical protein
MLEKLLNPFGMKITKSTALFAWTGLLTSLFLHVGFYVTLIHFVIKFW